MEPRGPGWLAFAFLLALGFALGAELWAPDEPRAERAFVLGMAP
jgi:hypothetical protein